MAPINDFIEVIQHKILVTAGDDFSCNVYDLTKEPKVGGEIKQEGEKWINLINTIILLT